MARIVVGEDDPDIAELLRFKLQEAGHTVVLADNGHAVMEAIAADRTELVVLDVMMPKMDGFEVCRRVTAWVDPPKVLLLTARGREEDVQRGFDVGAADYVVKPFSPRELVSRVTVLLR